MKRVFNLPNMKLMREDVIFAVENTGIRIPRLTDKFMHELALQMGEYLADDWDEILRMLIKNYQEEE